MTGPGTLRKAGNLLVVRTASIALLTSLAAACSTGAGTSSAPTNRPAPIQPSISHATTGDTAAGAAGKRTRAWVTDLTKLVADYPKNANSDQRASLAAALADSTPVTGTCTPPEQGPQFQCWFGADDASRSWLVIGDNTIDQWTPAFEEMTASRRTLRIDTFKATNCLNSIDAEGRLSVGESGMTTESVGACAAMQEAALSYARAGKPDLVLLLDSGGRIGSPKEKAYTVGLQAMAAELKDIAPVVLMGRTPTWNVTPATCFNSDLSNLPSCYGSTVTNARQGSVQQATARSAGAVFLDPRTWLCSKNICPLFIRDTIVTVDGSRLTKPMSKALAGVLYENLDSARK